MLKDIICEILMGLTNFVRVVFYAEEFVDTERNIFMRFIVKVSNIIGWILTQLILISLTGGLYLIWVAIKLMWKTCKRRHRNRKLRRKRA